MCGARRLCQKAGDDDPIMAEWILNCHAAELVWRFVEGRPFTNSAGDDGAFACDAVASPSWFPDLGQEVEMQVEPRVSGAPPKKER